MEDSDGRKPAGWLPELIFEGEDPVVQVIREETGEILYIVRVKGNRFQPKVYAPGTYTVNAGRDRPEDFTLAGLAAGEKMASEPKMVKI
jgi:hypothetical protein